MAGHLTGLTCMRKQALASLLVAGSRRQAGIRKRRHEVPFSRPGQAREAILFYVCARILVAFLPRLDSFFIHDLPVGVLLGGGTEGLVAHCETAQAHKVKAAHDVLQCRHCHLLRLGLENALGFSGFPR